MRRLVSSIILILSLTFASSAISKIISLGGGSVSKSSAPAASSASAVAAAKKIAVVKKQNKKFLKKFYKRWKKRHKRKADITAVGSVFRVRDMQTRNSKDEVIHEGFVIIMRADSVVSESDYKKGNNSYSGKPRYEALVMHSYMKDEKGLEQLNHCAALAEKAKSNPDTKMKISFFNRPVRTLYYGKRARYRRLIRMHRRSLRKGTMTKKDIDRLAKKKMFKHWFGTNIDKHDVLCEIVN
ncbi:MAG: hypothetical protein HOE90_23915 [Bacteriovoracaceae bacterium]|jgi:hypothetical protein|nr:hypothetical protein [Bacteriovoracaceae bacterium]